MTAELTSPAAVASSAPPSAPAPTRRIDFLRHPLGAFLALLSLVLVIYAPSLGGEFLWDDNSLVKGEALVHSPLLCGEVFRHTLFSGDSNFYRPAQSLTYILDYWCWGLDPFGYHLTNALLHACNGFLLFLLLRRVLPALVPGARRVATDWAALALAAGWAIHPVHSATVAYISGRADSLAMCFCLSAWLLCERAFTATGRGARVGWAAGAFLCLLLGLCSKEIAFVWLVLFAGWLFCLRPDGTPGPAPRRVRRGQIAALVGGALALGAYLWLRHLPPPSPLPLAATVDGLPAKWVLILRALGDYGRLLLFPDRLLMERQVFAAPALANPAAPSYYNALTSAGVLVLAALVVGSFLPGRGRSLRRAGAVWFAVAFLPVSNLFSLNASVAEHWLYLPSVGLLLFLAGVALEIPWQRLPAAGRSGAAVALAASLILGAFGLRTWLRSHDWATKVDFYRQTIRDGGDFPRDREGLAQAYAERGDKVAATALLGDLARHYPTDFSARVSLGTILASTGHLEEARTSLEGVAADLLTSNDRRAGPRECAVAIRALDRLEPSGDPAWSERRRALLERATGRFPGSWELLQLRIADRERANDPAGAFALVADFSAKSWWHAPARVVTGRLLAALGRPDEALAAWEMAARLDVGDADALSAGALLCLQQGWLPEALTLQTRAVDRQPASLRQRLLLAQIFDRLGRGADAEGQREEARRIAAEAGQDSSGS